MQCSFSPPQKDLPKLGSQSSLFDACRCLALAHRRTRIRGMLHQQTELVDREVVEGPESVRLA